MPAAFFFFFLNWKSISVRENQEQQSNISGGLSTSYVSKQALSFKKNKKQTKTKKIIKPQHTALNTVLMIPFIFIDTFHLRFQ